MTARTASTGTGYLLALALLAPGVPAAGQEPAARAAEPQLAADYQKDIRPLLVRSCAKCHSTNKRQEGDIDLEQFATFADLRKAPRTWIKVLDMLDTGQMPPRDAPQPSDADKTRLRTWVRAFLKAEARAQAGDPGPVVLRRLSNAEYAYTLRDLTGLVDLDPTRQFPGDSAAGEGFTNTGQALVMSPALLAKYLDAAKDVAGHAVLLPDGLRFSPATTRRDWTNEILDRIRALYRRHSDSQGGTRVNLQGIVFDTNDGGRLPLEKYLTATLAERDALTTGRKSVADVARERGLNARYLATLWDSLTGREPSPLLDLLRSRWQKATTADVTSLARDIGVWQAVLTQVQRVGHMKPWLVSATPVVARQDVRVKIPASAPGKDVVLTLAAADAGDGSANDIAVWRRPRFVVPGRPDLLLRDVRAFAAEVLPLRDRTFAATERCLAAAAEASEARGPLDIADLARRHNVEPAVLSAWLDTLGLGRAVEPKRDYLTNKLDKNGNYDFVKGWGKAETPNLVANASDRFVRIPGDMKGHGVCVHPSPTLQAVVGWRSPIAGVVRVRGTVTHAHPACGNGVTWELELQRGGVRRRLAGGVAQGSKGVAFGPFEKLAVRQGDFLALKVGPRDGNHACDFTDLEWVITTADSPAREWSLTRDVSADVLAGNPHDDRFGNRGVWHFCTEPDAPGGATVPAGSLLARWLEADGAAARTKLAADLQRLLTTGPPADANHPDALLYRQFASLSGPLLGRLKATGSTTGAKGQFGVDPALFGTRAVGPEDLCVSAPAVVEVRLPADLFAGAEFVASGVLHPQLGAAGSVQLQAAVGKAEKPEGLRPDLPLLVNEAGPTRQRWERAFDDFRRLFPAALCYTKIVPVDEVVTLTLFHREDEPLCRLMLDAREKEELDRLWDELHFVSHDALTLVDAFKQLLEYASQDSDPKLFEPFRKPIHDRAAAFRRALVDAEPRHLDAVVAFAGRAYRRPLAPSESEQLRGLYRSLRQQELPHEEAIRLTLARVLTAPAFLYKLEKAPPGNDPKPVSDDELASRLSYFLWSSAPDDELRRLAAAGRLRDPDVLSAQAKRLLQDDRVRRLAVEFGCQYLHVHGFDHFDEKSERHFPSFPGLRGALYEEPIRFFTDLFQQDRPLLHVFDADYTFVNEDLAKHYGLPGVSGPQWRRVDGVRQHGRGGILGMGATLAKQSGASRTSPILRGNWISEVLLGEKLPRPPKDVPRLPEDENTGDLTVRQQVQRHSSDARCAVCHVRIDPFGFALEGFDAIGRRRAKDLAGRPIDTRARLKDGTEFDGLAGLRQHLVAKRRDDMVRVFCRKLLGYALGRGVQLSDEVLLDDIEERLRKNDYRISVAVETIVRSRPFRAIRGRDAIDSVSH